MQRHISVCIYSKCFSLKQESEPWILPATLVIFMLINVFDSFILVGLFVAVVTGTFKRMREIQNAFMENNGFITDEVTKFGEMLIEFYLRNI